jgi:dethiobiotin synthetase
LAARAAGTIIEPDVVCDAVESLRNAATHLVVELAGGLFSPLTESVTNAELVARLAPSHLVLVAPDRLGVLHDAIATLRAAALLSVVPSVVALVPPEDGDSSTGTNGGELRAITGRSVVEVGRSPVEHLAQSEALGAIYALLG